MHNAVSALAVLVVGGLILLKNVIHASNDKDFKNVCVDWKHYYGNREKYCYTNPTAYYEVPDIIKYYGYPVEEYNVTTADNYVLKMFRIPNEGKPPVLITHGVRRNSAIYVDIGKDSLAYVLWRNGYDVWLLNYRGSMYSSHLHLNQTQKEFWDFSFSEMAVGDGPAAMDLVYEKTGQKMIYIGWSLGTTNFLALNSLNPSYGESRIRVGILLAPIAYLYKVKTPMTFLLLDGIYQLVLFIAKNFTNGAYAERTPATLKLYQTACLPYPFQMQFCMDPTYLFEGFDKPQQNPETLPIIVMQHFDAISIKTFIHFTQLLRTNKFQFYDYGKKKNLNVYGTKEPPLYNLTNVRVPSLFMRGGGDWLSTEEDLKTTMSDMRPSAKIGVYEIPYKPFAHSDFTDAKDAGTLVYDYIVNFLKVNGSKYT